MEEHDYEDEEVVDIPVSEMDSIYDAITQTFPPVTKRTYKQPEFFWNTEFDHVRVDDVVVVETETDGLVKTTSTCDFFYRKEKTNDPWIYAYSHKSYSKYQKILCIGGPLDGTAVVSTELVHNKDYVIYNYAGYGSSRGSTFPKMVSVYAPKLKGPKP